MKPGRKLMSAGTFAVISILAIAFLPTEKAQLAILALVGLSVLYLLFLFFLSRPRAAIFQEKSPRQQKPKRSRREKPAPVKEAPAERISLDPGVVQEFRQAADGKPAVALVVPDVPEVPTEYKVTMLRHINFRITEKLQAAFPGATWRWSCDDPLELAMSGGEAKIYTYGADDYNQAEVLFLANGRIGLNMVTSKPLGNIGRVTPPAKEPAAKEDPDSLDLRDWYEVSASPVIRATIDEVFTRGHKRLYIGENGDVFVVEDKSEVKQGKLQFVPSKKLWDELVPLFADDDITMAAEDSRMTLTWAG